MCSLATGVACGKDDPVGQPWVAFLHCLPELLAIHVRHGQVRQDQIERLLIQQTERLLRLGGGCHLESCLLQEPSYGRGDHRLVINDQDASL